MQMTSSEPITSWTDQDFDRQADLHRRIVRLLWIAAGGVYVGFTGRVLSLALLMVVIPGIAVAAFMAEIGWAVCIWLLLARVGARRRQRWFMGRIIGLSGCIWLCTMLAGPMYLAVVYVRVIRTLLHQP